MSTLEQIEQAILQLSPDEFRRLSDWILELDQRRWDEQIERDSANGKLDALAEKAVADYKAGLCRPL